MKRVETFSFNLVFSLLYSLLLVLQSSLRNLAYLRIYLITLRRGMLTSTLLKTSRMSSSSFFFFSFSWCLANLLRKGKGEQKLLVSFCMHFPMCCFEKPLHIGGGTSSGCSTFVSFSFSLNSSSSWLAFLGSNCLMVFFVAWGERVLDVLLYYSTISQHDGTTIGC